MKILHFLAILLLPGFMFAQVKIQNNTTETTAVSENQYWAGVDRQLATTPYGNQAALVCHNCYEKDQTVTDAGYHLKSTLQKIHRAQQAGADLIELDIIEIDDEIRIRRKDDGNRNSALLDEVLKDEVLKMGNQLLFIEIKETTGTSEQFVWNLLNMLNANGYAQKGRPVVIRAFENDVRYTHLLKAQVLLADHFKRMQPFVKLSVLLNPSLANDEATFAKKIVDAKSQGFDMVELNYKTKNIFSHIALAKSLDLGVSIWTLPNIGGDVFLASLREEADALSTEFQLAKARKMIVHNNGLLYFNTKTAHTKTVIAEDNGKSLKVNLQNTNQPAQVPFGTSTAYGFQSGSTQYLQTDPVENKSNSGYLVTTLVQFDRIDLNENERATLLSKSEDGDFRLELYNPGGSMPTVLRFGVKVGREFKYSFLPASALNTGEQYLITGAYDADGTIELWINHDNKGVRQAHAKGGVASENSPIYIGAAPEEMVANFDGKIQMASIQSWR